MLRLDGGSAEEATCQVVEEVPLSIFINGRHFVTAMTSPQMRKEFVTGHLFQRGLFADRWRSSLWRSRAT